MTDTSLVTIDPKNRKRTVTAAGAARIEELAAAGKNEVMIRKTLALGDRDVWRRIKADQPEVAEALEVGRARFEDMLLSMLLEKAKGADKNAVIALIYLTKARCGWRDRDATTSGGDDRPNVVINLPAPVRPEDYRSPVQAEWHEETPQAPPQATLRGGVGRVSR